MIDLRLVVFLVRRELAYFLRKPVFFVWAAIFSLLPVLWSVFFRHVFAVGLSSFSSYVEAVAFIVPPGLAFFLVSLYRGRDARDVAEFFSSLPVSSYEIVLYKYFAAVLLIFISFFFCLPFFLMFSFAGTFYAGELFSVFLGFFLFVVFFAAVNSFLVQLYDNPAFSLVFTVIVDMLLLFIAPFVSAFSLHPALSSFIRFFSPVLHFSRIADAYISVRDVLWFVVLAVFFLFLLCFFMEIKRCGDKKRTAFLLQLGILILLVFAHSALSDGFVDLSHKKRHTLSSVTRSLLKKIDEPLYIDYYYSDVLQQQSPVPDDVMSHLSLYARYNNNVVLNFKRLSARDADVERLGIIPQQIQLNSANSISYSTVYSGISISYMDNVWVIPVVYGQDLLQFQMASAFDALIVGMRPVVGVFTRETGDDYKRSYVNMVGALARGFDVIAVGPDNDEDFDVLVVIDRGSMKDADVSFIASAIRAHKSVLFAVDSVDVNPQDYFSVFDRSDSPLLKFLGSLGIKIKNRLIAINPGLKIPLLEEGSSARTSSLVDYPLWLDLKSADIDGLPWKDWFTGLHLYWAEPVELINSAWKKAIVSQPAYSVELDKSILPGSVPPPIKEQDMSYTVSAFYQSDDGHRMFFVSDADFLSDLTDFTSAQSNMDFLLSACTWLAGKDRLISLITLDSSVDRIKIRPDSPDGEAFIFVFNLVNIFIIPGFLLLIALLTYVRGYNGKKD